MEIYLDLQRYKIRLQKVINRILNVVYSLTSAKWQIGSSSETNQEELFQREGT
jgi:hypothetical protein